MALFVLGSLFLRAPWLYQEKRFQPDLSRFGPFATPIAGAVFGFGWTPCIGPVLTSILAIAAAEGSAGRGALLLAVVLRWPRRPVHGDRPCVRAPDRSLRLGQAPLHRHHDRIGSLAVFGLILALDRLVWVTTQLQLALDSVGLDILVELG